MALNSVHYNLRVVSTWCFSMTSHGIAISLSPNFNDIFYMCYQLFVHFQMVIPGCEIRWLGHIVLGMFFCLSLPLFLSCLSIVLVCRYFGQLCFVVLRRCSCLLCIHFGPSSFWWRTQRPHFDLDVDMETTYKPIRSHSVPQTILTKRYMY